MTVENILGRVIEAGGRIRVKSALNPILWMCAIIGGPCFLVILVKDNPPSFIIWILCAVVGVALFGFLFLLFFDRDKLQSEDYQLKKRELEMVQEKGEKQPRVLLNDEYTETDLLPSDNIKEIEYTSED